MTDTRRSGQTTLEFALLIAVVVGALLAMQVYMKRGVQGKIKESTDQIGDQFHANTATYSFIRNVNSNSREESFSNGLVNTNVENFSQTRTGNEHSVGLNLGNENLIY